MSTTIFTSAPKNSNRQPYHCDETLLPTGKFKFILSKRADRRTEDEKRKLEDVAADNKIFLDLELIKESVFEIFRHDNAKDARKQFETTGEYNLKTMANQESMA